jgi:methylated-DNA-[protein]-cysteine S-methyltransferase
MTDQTIARGAVIRFSRIGSPIGELLLLSDGHALCGLSMQEGRHPLRVRPEWKPDDGPFGEVRDQLAGYFAGERTTFELPLRLDGSPFQRQVWNALREIPYGTTTSYGEIARRVGRPGAARAVGLANGQNPIAVIVPCHRVIGADGSLTGYGGGLERKQLLLGLEARAAEAEAPQQQLSLEPADAQVGLL